MTLETLTYIVPVVEMRKYCIVSLLLLGLGFGANAHNTPEYYTRGESHTPTTDFHHWVVNNDEDRLHWHFGDGEAGGWSPCVAAAYNEADDSYGLLPDGNCGEFSTKKGNNGNNVNNNDKNDNGLKSLNSLNDNSDSDNSDINEFNDVNEFNDNNENNGNNENSENSGTNGNNGNHGNSGNNGDNGNHGNNDGNNGGNNGGSSNGNQGRSTGGVSGSGGSAVLCEDGKGYSAPEESNHWPSAIVVVSEDEEEEEEEEEEDTETDSTTPPDPIKKTSGESSDSTAYLTFTMTFPEGVNSLHLPFKPYTAFYFTDLFELLEDDNTNAIAALRPTVQIWSIISNSPSVHDEWISRYRGFLIDMEETVEVTFIRDAYNYGYDMIYLKDGMNLIGVPRDSEYLAIVSDFFVVFDCVAWVEVMIDGETQILYHPALESVQLVSTLDGDTEISPTQGYMVMSLDDDEYPVWGDPWGEKTVPVVSGQ